MGAEAKTTTDKSAARREQAAVLHESTTAKVAQPTDTEAWTAYLTAAAAFHSYSFNNVMLSFSQAPDASQVAGFCKWPQLGRQVGKGEKSIKIFGYSTKKITETDTRDRRGNHPPSSTVPDPVRVRHPWFRQVSASLPV